MILETERLLLRPWEESDAEACYAYAKDPRVGPIAGWAPHKNVEESRKVIRDILSAPETYAIVLKETGLPVGSIGFHHDDLAKDDGETELGYWIGVPYWGRGLVPEAARELIRHAFEDLALERIWCGYYDGNERSKRVQEKLGFRYQWTSHDVPVPQLGETRTGHVNLLTKEEWLKDRKAAPAMKIRRSTERDLARILEIYAAARAFMAAHGNPTQWGPTGWPPEALIRKDIRNGNSYVCESGGKVVGTFYFAQGEDVEPTYRVITDGAWSCGGPYGVVHRIASDGSQKGVGAFCLNWAFDKCGHLRIDTHGDNKVMQTLLSKLGFTHRGTIYVEEDDMPRLAFEKCADAPAKRKGD